MLWELTAIAVCKTSEISESLATLPKKYKGLPIPSTKYCSTANDVILVAQEKVKEVKGGRSRMGTN